MTKRWSSASRSTEAWWSWSLLAAGYEVYAINPLAARVIGPPRHLWAKSDPGDAKVLADLVRTDRHNHRPIAGDSDLAEGVKLLGPGASERHLGSPAPAQACARRCVILPGGSGAFGTDLASTDALAILAMPPRPSSAGGCRDRRSPRRCAKVAASATSTAGRRDPRRPAAEQLGRLR